MQTAVLTLIPMDPQQSVSWQQVVDVPLKLAIGHINETSTPTRLCHLTYKIFPRIAGAPAALP